MKAKTRSDGSWSRKIALLSLSLLAGLLPGCTTYIDSPPPATIYEPPPPPPVVYAEPAPPPPPAPVVEIRAESDFYEPLRPYGRWLEVPGYGRCWSPAGVEPEWRPYTEGQWQRTDAGWFWVSREPWGWATFHYGRWHQDHNLGWVWIPSTQWAPAWVAWREGGGYTGWAPLPPDAKIGLRGDLDYRAEDLEPHSFVFVERGRMLEPQRRQTVIINNNNIINHTVNITKIVVVNKTVINEGPHPENVAQAAGRKVEVVPVHTLRNRQEAPAVTERAHAPSPEQNRTPTPPPAHNPAETPLRRTQGDKANAPVVPAPIVAQPIIAKPNPPAVVHEQRPPAITNQFKPAPRPPVLGQPPSPPNPPKALPGQVPRLIAPEPSKPGQNSRTNAVMNNGLRPTRPGQPAPSSPQELEREQRQKALEKRHQQSQIPSSHASTNAPVSPH